MMPEPGKNIGAILLAAGGSTRMGQPKLLLKWHGDPLVRWVARLALGAGCSPLVVVTGSHSGQIRRALADLPLRFVHNPDWASGQSTSVIAGVSALPAETDAVIVFLGDQPQIPLEVVRQLQKVYREEQPAEPILVPAVNGKRANPVLLDRRVFKPLTSLEGDTGARSLFSQFSVRFVSFHNSELLLDIDSPEDYRELMDKAPPLLPED